MQYPDDTLRDELHRGQYESEEDCAQGLNLVWSQLQKRAHVDEGEDPTEVLLAVQGWASLASYVVAQTYAPQSPMRYAGWARNIPYLLQRIAALLRLPLLTAARALGASAASVSGSFPWGISVTLEWSV
ncbi:hypothetical protein ACFY7C_12070 [Streptomyces sp. NPDC012769]|uniref:hypothetical protein n=1 Tax=Streptomyces sp. NPDC012769 TaxID=3364848 RepID=UPI003686BF6D